MCPQSRSVADLSSWPGGRTGVQVTGKARSGQWWLGWLSLLAAGTGDTRTPTASLAHYRAWNYTADAGLDSESLLHITRLTDGRILLVGVRGEPQLFDGHRFTALPYRSEKRWTAQGAMATTQSADGALWLAGAAGLARFAEGQLVSIDLPAGAVPFHVRTSTDPGEVLVPTRTGVYRIDTTPPFAARLLGPANLPATAVVQDRAGVWWIGTSDGLYLLTPDGTATPVADPRLHHVHIWALHVDRFGRVLAATRGLGLAIFAPGMPPRLLGRAEGLPHNTVRAIAETDDALWLATAGGGIARWDERTLGVFDSADGLSSDSVTWLTADASGVLWASTAGAGLNRLWPSPFTNLADAQGRRGGFHYTVFRSADGRLWAGSNQGLSQVFDDHTEWIGAPGEGQSATVLGMLDAPDGGLYLASRRGVFHHADGRGFTLLPGTSELVNPALWHSPQLGFLVASGNTLYQLHADRAPSALLVLATEAAVIQTFADDPRYGLLLATRDGVWAFDGQRATALGPRGRAAGGFWRDGERLYVSGNGLAVLDAAGWQVLLPTLDSGPRSTWYKLMPDRLGALWITGRDGLLRLDRQQLRASRAGQMPEHILFTLRDGLPSTEFEGSPQGAHADDEGRLWLASTGGLTRLDPAALGTPPPQLALSVQAIDNEDRRFDAVPGLALPAGTRRVALTLATLPASHAAAVQLRYRLLPLESGYRSDRGLREAVYGGLPPGDYTLELEGEISGLAALRAHSSFEFRIQPRLLQRTGVQVALAFIGLGLLAALPTWHIRALRRQRRRLLDQIAAQTAALEELARTDGLTGLLNRRAFDEALRQSLAPDRGTRAILLVIDVDHFKAFNDQLGHQAGDHCLRAVARALTQAAPAGACVARIGGEEFAMLVPVPATHDSTVCTLGEALRAAIAGLQLVHPTAGGPLTVSLGAAQALPGETPDSLLRRADDALYAAKRSGRDRLVLA